MLNCGARRAAFRRRKLRIPRPAAGGRSRSLRCASSPHESRCACFRGDPFPIKYEVRSQSRKKAPSMRTALFVCNKPGNQRLLNCGARRAALRPYCFLPYGRKLLILLGVLRFRASVNRSSHPFHGLSGGDFLGANALFTTEDNALGLSPFSSRYANLDGVCFEVLRY